MKGWVGMLKQFRYPSNRQAFFAMLFSGILLVVFIFLWLYISTRTALMNNELAELEGRQFTLTQNTNLLWTELGQITSPEQMKLRMDKEGFITPEDKEFLVPAPTAVISPTITSTPGGNR
jgi:hypothetical protein